MQGCNSPSRTGFSKTFPVFSEKKEALSGRNQSSHRARNSYQRNMNNSTSQHVEGYPRLASHIAQYSENAVFRRFGGLCTRNLLYLQAELVHLEQKLYRLEATDSTSSEGHRARYSKDWYWLDNPSDGDAGEQSKTVLSIRSKLKEYYEAVLQQSVISRLANPEKHDLRALQDWLEREAFGNLALIGADRETWGRTDQPDDSHDLFTLNSGRCEDSFSRWFSRKFIAWFHYTFWHRRSKSGGDLESGINYYSSNVTAKYTSFVTNVVASLLPILATVVLYFASSMKLRLGLTVLFTLVFTSCVSAFTSSKRGEIFMATSTFAAVQVVFISASNGWSNTA